MTNTTDELAGETSSREASFSYLMKLAAPAIVSSASFTVMQFLDRYMVSRLGTDELAAVLPAGAVAFVPGSFAIGVATAISTYASQSLGRGRPQDASRYMWQGLFMGYIYTLACLSILWPVAPTLFAAMGHEPGVAALEVVYLRILLYAQFFAITQWCATQFFMGIHRPFITMCAVMVGQVVNVCCNYVLIFGKFGFPAMGIAGAGWGTFIGLAVSALLLLIAFSTGKVGSQFESRRNIAIEPSKMRQILKVGLPAGGAMVVNVAMWGVLLFWLVGLAGGKEALAATSAVFSCINISEMPVIGLSSALTAAVGKSIGHGRKDMAIRQTGLALRVGMLYMGIMGFVMFVMRHQIMAFWSSSQSVVDTGKGILICAAIFQVFAAMTLVYTGALRGAGDTIWLVALAAVSSVLVLGGGGLFVVKMFPDTGPLGPWVAGTINIIVVSMANRWRFRSEKWRHIDIFRGEEAPAPLRLQPRS